MTGVSSASLPRPRARPRSATGQPAIRPVRRAAGIAVIANPFAGRYVEDLSPLFDVGLELV